MLIFDVYEMWVPLFLSLSIAACGFMLGWMARGREVSRDAS